VQLRIAIGFTSSGRRSKNIGECWDSQCSEDHHFEIFIRPDLSDQRPAADASRSHPRHELVHAAVGVVARHGKAFSGELLAVIGLVGQWRPPQPGPSREGHAADTGSCRAAATRRLQLAIGASSHSSRRRKQRSGQIKCACNSCGYTVHTTRKWLESAGAPLCPSMVKWIHRRCNLPRPCSGITPSA